MNFRNHQTLTVLPCLQIIRYPNFATVMEVLTIIFGTNLVKCNTLKIAKSYLELPKEAAMYERLLNSETVEVCRNNAGFKGTESHFLFIRRATDS